MIKKLIDKMRPEAKTRIAVMSIDPMVIMDDFGQVIGVMVNGSLAPFTRAYVTDNEQVREIEDSYDRFPLEYGEDGMTYLVTD